MKLRPQTTWRGEHRGLQIKIVNWDCGGMGPVWNYYVYLPEQKLGDKFQAIWLEDKITKITPESMGFVTHDYYTAPYINVDAWHGGITYYAKHGYTEGRRCVEIGCDYNHLWDREHGYPATLESVTQDAIATVDQLIEALGLDVPVPTSQPDSPPAELGGS